MLETGTVGQAGWGLGGEFLLCGYCDAFIRSYNIMVAQGAVDFMQHAQFKRKIFILLTNAKRA